MSDTLFGLYKAHVAQNFDPLGLGRIRVRFIQDNSISDNELPYADYCSPLGGGADPHQGAGFFMIPNVGDTVFIMFENGDVSKPVWMGSPFFGGLNGTQNPPIESRVTNTEPLNRIIKTSYGHKIELDDRELDLGGQPTQAIRITSGLGRTLILNDSENSIELKNAVAQPHQLIMNKNGVKLESARGNGLFLSDKRGTALLANYDNSSFINLSDTQMILQTKGSSFIRANSFDAKMNGDFVADAGSIKFKGSSFSATTSADIGLMSGNNITITAPMTTAFTTSNYLVDLPAVGVPQTTGNIHFNATNGHVGMRVGLNIPNPITPVGYVVSDAEFNDPAQAIGKLARISLGRTGAVALEGAIGGLYISPIPMPLPGSAAGLGGRPFGGAPLIPIIPSPIPGVGPQPAVLGGNLYTMLMTLLTGMQTLSAAMIASAPAFAVSPVGPAVLSPAVLGALIAWQTLLTTTQTLHLGAPGTPTNLLSSVVFIDG